MSDTLSGTTHPDDNDDHPWWGLPCTVTPCFGARLVQEGARILREYVFLSDWDGGLRRSASLVRMLST